MELCGITENPSSRFTSVSPPDTLISDLDEYTIRKWVCEDDLDNCFKTLHALEAQAADIIRWYLHRMEPTGGKCVRYEDAAAIIGGVKHAKTRARMLYLLRKTSDSRNLTAALEKLKKAFDLNGGQIKRLLKKFRKCGISPITLPNSEPQSVLEPIGDVIERAAS